MFLTLLYKIDGCLGEKLTGEGQYAMAPTADICGDAMMTLLTEVIKQDN
jgi:hypothetical protein